MKRVEKEDIEVTPQMFLGEILRARKRLYGDERQTPEFRLRNLMEWFLKFIQTDLGDLSSGDWINLRWDIECFTIMGDSLELGLDYSKKNEISEVELDDIFNWPDETDPTSEESRCAVPSNNTVIHIQKIVLAHVKNLLDNNKTTILIPELKITINKGSHKYIDAVKKAIGEDLLLEDADTFTEVESIPKETYVDIVITSTTAKTPLIIFEYYLSSMLAKYALRIAECPECKIIFLSNRKDQRFCTTRCQSRLTMRKIRNTPPERMNKRGRPKKENNGGVNHAKKKLKG